MKKYQLPKEFAEKWIAALRSGEYKQGSFRLKNEYGRYCCLGVACAMNGFTELGEAQFIGNVIDGTTTTSGTKNIRKLLKTIPKSLKGDGNNELVECLTDMNDAGNSFIKIADWIEQNVEFI